MSYTQIDLLAQDYPSRSLDQNQSILVNMYLEADKFKGKYPVIALPTPGLSLFADTSEANVRAIFEQNQILYVVAGNHFYSINSSGVVSSVLGTLNTSSGFAKIVSISGSSDTNNQLFIIDGTNGYSYNIGSTVATFPITDVDFPQTCIDCTARDDYILVAKLDSISFNISNLSDSLSWDALDFASKISEADRLTAIRTHLSKVWLFGNKTSEVWYNNGNADFPFGPVPDTFLQYGCSAKNSISSNEDYMLFLSANSRGGYSVVKAQPSQAYTPTPLSTQAHDSLISSFSVVSDAIGYCYTKDGHKFYDLTFPTAGYTFVFDLSSGAISTRQSFIGAAYTRFLASCQSFCFGKNLVGDYQSGKIYSQETAIYTENGTAIRRIITSPSGVLYAGGKRVFVNRLQIDVETGIGSNKTFTLEKSMDNGSTWNTVNTYTIPSKGNRIIENRLGSSKDGILFRITTTMDAKFIVLGFYADINIGHS